MTIQDYYDDKNYKKNKKYTPKLYSDEAKTIAEFYQKCLSKHISDPSYIANAKAWHKMLMEYVEDPDAVFWIRYHENGPKNPITGRYQTRRACKTVFADGTTYVFVSNYDAHEIFNMVRLGVVPDKNEFKSLMKNHLFPLHYDNGGKCEESDGKAYPCIGSVKGGVLTAEHWYLAHIVGIKSDVYVKSGKQLNVDIEKLYPRGEITEWKDDHGVKVRKLNYSLSPEEKDIIKAHFLRFVDPLNYYVVPGEKFQKNGICKQIGSSFRLNDYMRKKYDTTYCSDYKDFEKKALAPDPDEIYMKYAPPAKKTKTKTPPPPASPSKGSGSKRKPAAGKSIPPITLTPSDPDLFKDELLKGKKAKIIWEYRDGSREEKIWHPDKFKSTSSVSGNIMSRPQWRDKGINGLVEVKIEIL